MQCPLWVALVVIVIVFALVWYASRARKSRETFGGAGPSIGDRLAKAGWELYTSEGCGHCTSQLSALGGSYAKRIECSGGAPACRSIEALPTWKKGGRTVVGFQTPEALERLLQN